MTAAQHAREGGHRIPNLAEAPTSPKSSVIHRIPRRLARLRGADAPPTETRGLGMRCSTPTAPSKRCGGSSPPSSRVPRDRDRSCAGENARYRRPGLPAQSTSTRHLRRLRGRRHRVSDRLRPTDRDSLTPNGWRCPVAPPAWKAEALAAVPTAQLRAAAPSPSRPPRHRRCPTLLLTHSCVGVVGGWAVSNLLPSKDMDRLANSRCWHRRG
jgi:hypothetical protein